MKQDDYQLIEKIILGTADEGEKLLLESKLVDPDFKKAFEDYSVLKESIAIHERRRLKMLLEKSDEVQKTFTLSMPVRLAIAASVTFLILVTGYFVFFSKDSSEKLFNEYYADYSSLNLARPRGEAESYQLKMEAYSLYKEGDTKKSISIIETVLNKDNQDEEALLIRGLSFLKSNQFESAVSDLKSIKQLPEAKWYLALAHIAMGNNQLAIPILEELSRSTPPSDFAQDATRLLAEIKSE